MRTVHIQNTIILQLLPLSDKFDVSSLKENHSGQARNLTCAAGRCKGSRQLLCYGKRSHDVNDRALILCTVTCHTRTCSAGGSVTKHCTAATLTIGSNETLCRANIAGCTQLYTIHRSADLLGPSKGKNKAASLLCFGCPHAFQGQGFCYCFPGASHGPWTDQHKVCVLRVQSVA